MIFYRRFENVSIWIAVIFKISYLKGNRGWLDWTLKWREGTMKSKKEVKAVRIGRWSRGKARWSPKKKPKLVGLDVEAEGRHDEVQKRSQSWLDWTFMQRKGTKKSKKEVEAWKNRKFKKFQKSLKKLLTLYWCGDIIIKSSANSERHENKTSSRGGIGIRARLRI